MINGFIIHRIWLRMDKRILIIYSTFDCINEMHRISAIALIVLLTLGSIGLNINTHVCQGELKSIRVFIPAKSCSSMADGVCTQRNHSDGFNKTPCCTDKCFATPQSLFESLDCLTAESIQLIGPILSESPKIFKDHSNQFVLNKYVADPPDRLYKKVHILFQVFRI